jgi:hypothetical protein
MEDLQATPETRPQPAYALLSFGQYFTLNQKISSARGWKIGGSTERTFPMNPPAAKVNIVIDQETGEAKSFDEKLVMRLSSQMQIDHADLLEGVELHKTYIPVDNPVREFDVDLTDFDTIDWTIKHYAKARDTGDAITLRIASAVADNLPSQALSQIESLGLELIVV